MQRVVARAAIVGGAYFATGALGLQLAIEPGLASPIWPPAGIALAAALRWRGSALVGVWLGSFLLHGIVGSQWAVAALIGIGAVLQTVVAERLVRWIVGGGDPLVAGASASRWLLAAGPGACLVNGIWSPGVLLLAGLISADNLWSTCVTWWAGDTVGVLTMTPLVLAWSQGPGQPWRRRLPVLTLGLLGTLSAVVALFADAFARERDGLDHAFALNAQSIEQALERDLRILIEEARATAGLFEASSHVTREEFTAFAGLAFEPRAGRAAIAWVPVVTDRDRAAYASAAIEAGFRLGEDAAEKPFTLPIFYAGPDTPFPQFLLGLDQSEDPARLRAFEAALRRRNVEVSAPLTSPIDGEPVILIVVPVRPELAVSPAARLDTQHGFAVVVVRPAPFIESTLMAYGSHALRMRVTDVTDATPAPVYQSAPGPRDGLHRPTAPGTLAVGGRTWDLELWADPSEISDLVPWTVLIAGVALTGGLVVSALESAARTLRVEALVAERTADLYRSNLAFQRSNREIQRFGYVAAHDLREPLRAVTTYAELLQESQRDRLDAGGRLHLARMVESARRMQTLITELLELARVESATTPVRSAALGDLVEAAIASLRPQIDAVGARIDVTRLPVVACDPAALVQVFQNLLSNALKFRRAEVPPEIRVSATSTADGWEIHVRDNGIGIEAAHHARVFEIFQRLHPRDRYPGTGLGLALCRTIVERHGGQIGLASEPGVGTTVTFTLPRRDP